MEVLISVERESSPSDSLHLKFSVRDTGIGIAKDKIRFVCRLRAGRHLDRAEIRGSGSVSRSSSALSVSCRASYAGERAGKGSVFSFISPFELEPNPPAAERWPDLGHFPVLIVDRNQAARAVVRQMLSGHGAIVTEAASYEAGITESSRPVPQGSHRAWCCWVIGSLRKHLRQWSSSLRRRRSVRRRSSR